MGCGAGSGGAGGIQRVQIWWGESVTVMGGGLDDFAGDPGLELGGSGSISSSWRSGSGVLVGCKGLIAARGISCW